MKFLHTMGAIGLMGAMASFLVLLSIAPPPADLEAYALVRSAMDLHRAVDLSALTRAYADRRTLVASRQSLLPECGLGPDQARDGDHYL